MDEFPLVLDDVLHPVPHLSLRQSCKLFSNQGPSPPYHVRTQPDPVNFRTFIKAIVGDKIEITPENYSDLSRLSKEFRCFPLLLQLAAFRESPEHRISLLEDRLALQEQEMTGLKTLLISQLSAFVEAKAAFRALKNHRDKVNTFVLEQISSQTLQLRAEIAQETEEKLSAAVAELRRSQAAHETEILDLRKGQIDRKAATAIAKAEFSTQIKHFRAEITRETDQKHTNELSGLRRSQGTYTRPRF
jgi:uncharacterized coiled-coil protein SlyX